MDDSDIILECETKENILQVDWFINDVKLIYYPNNIKTETVLGRFHRLYITDASVEDTGKYSIRIKGVASTFFLHVKGSILNCFFLFEIAP